MTSSRPQTPQTFNDSATDDVTASLSRMRVTYYNNEKSEDVDHKNQRKRTKDDLTKSALSPPTSPQKKRIKVDAQNRAVGRNNSEPSKSKQSTLTPLQQEIEELQHGTKMRVFFGLPRVKHTKNTTTNAAPVASRRRRRNVLRKRTKKKDEEPESPWEYTETEDIAETENPDDTSPTDTQSTVKRLTGRPSDPLLDRLTVSYFDEKSGKDRWRCVGGCADGNWVNRNRPRIFKHVTECPKVATKLKQEANLELAKSSKGAEVEELDRNINAQADTTLSNTNSKTSRNVSKLSAQSTVVDLFSTTGKQQLQTRLDHAILILICVAGLALHVLDLDVWKAMLRIAAPYYRPFSRTKAETFLIPAEAARVREKQLEFLCTQYNLTISFDGGATRGKESFYTIHIATPNRQVFFFEGHARLDDAHTGDWLVEMNLAVSIFYAVIFIQVYFFFMIRL